MSQKILLSLPEERWQNVIEELHWARDQAYELAGDVRTLEEKETLIATGYYQGVLADEVEQALVEARKMRAAATVQMKVQGATALGTVRLVTNIYGVYVYVDEISTTHPVFFIDLFPVRHGWPYVQLIVDDASRDQPVLAIVRYADGEPEPLQVSLHSALVQRDRCDPYTYILPNKENVKE